MKEKEFIDMFTNNVCLLDPKVSLQAKGLYYSMLLNMYNEEHSFKEIIKSSRLDTDEVYLLLLDLIEHGYLYIAQPPLYKVEKGKEFFYAFDDDELDIKVQEKGWSRQDKNLTIQRFKGLGEMNSEQLWDTTMNPETRTLIRVGIEDPLLVERRIGVLMGKDAGLRKQWIEENIDFSSYDTFMEERK